MVAQVLDVLRRIRDDGPTSPSELKVSRCQASLAVTEALGHLSDDTVRDALTRRMKLETRMLDGLIAGWLFAGNGELRNRLVTFGPGGRTRANDLSAIDEFFDQR
jgi:hypothetical protein